MKGMVFTELLGFVEQTYGEDAVDDLIEGSDLPSGGAYTAVGTYDHREMQSLVTTLAAQSNTPPNELLSLFGQHLIQRFKASFPDFFKTAATLFDFLESIDNHIHVEVRKLYPDAELPEFRAERFGDGRCTSTTTANGHSRPSPRVSFSVRPSSTVSPCWSRAARSKAMARSSSGSRSGRQAR